MGVFDFIKDAGAKIGIGKSSEEREKEKADAAIQRGLEAQRKMAQEAMARRKEAVEKADDEEKKAREARRAAFKARKEERIKAAAKRKFQEYQKSNELEEYAKGLGLIEDDEIDIRFDDGIAYIEGVVPDQETREKLILAVGNAEGVARVNEEIEVVAPEPEAVMHTVVSGDTLWAIAEKVYGNGSRYPEIFEANQPMLTDPDLIFPGQVLRCPVGADEG